MLAVRLARGHKEELSASPHLVLMKNQQVFGMEFGSGIRRHRTLEFPKWTREWVWKPHSPELLAKMLRNIHTRKANRTAAVETNYRPSSARQKVVLSFFASDFFGQTLRQSGLKYFAVDFDQFAARGTVDIQLGEHFSAFFVLGNARLNLQDVRAVLWLPPPWMNYCNKPGPDTLARSNRQLRIQRWSQLLRDLPSLLAPGTLWLPSHPLNGSQEWQNRIAEFQTARLTGLKVPETICTTDAKAALAFLERCGGRALFRDFSLQPFGGPLEWITTKELRAKSRRLRLAPCVFVKGINKVFDVRAVVVGDRIFAVRINSQSSPIERARLDWRVYDNAHTPHERMSLPKAIERRMLILMKKLNLTWGSFDLVRGRDGAFYFLEVNRPGASGWLLPFVGLDVPAEIIAYLKRKLKT